MGLRRGVLALGVLGGLAALLWARPAAARSAPVLRQSSPDLGSGERLASAGGGEIYGPPLPPGYGYGPPLPAGYDSGGGFMTVANDSAGGDGPIWQVAKNPGNLRYSPANDWQGQVGSYRGFAAFSAFEYGIRAMAIVIGKDVAAGKTLRQIVLEYAPPHENDAGAYLARVSQLSGVSPDQVPDVWRLGDLLHAMIFVESGQDFRALIPKSLAMAGMGSVA
ncbi:MAG: hypothetical protein AMXMBFR26_06880 [Porticoccaceae bacterium]